MKIDNTEYGRNKDYNFKCWIEKNSKKKDICINRDSYEVLYYSKKTNANKDKNNVGLS